MIINSVIAVSGCAVATPTAKKIDRFNRRHQHPSGKQLLSLDL